MNVRFMDYFELLKLSRLDPQSGHKNSTLQELSSIYDCAHAE